MKKIYPSYKQGMLQEIEKKMSLKNKKILEEFCKLCSISAGEQKVVKIKRELVQIYDIIGKDLDKFTKKDVIDFLVLLNQSNRSIWTKNEIKVYLKKFIKWYYKDLELIELIKTTSSRDLNPIKINDNTLVTEEDIQKMLLCAETHKEKAFLYLIFESGARPQEILNLQWKDIKFNENGADITLYSGKTRKSRTFPLNKSAVYLKEWKENFQYPNVMDSDLVFPARPKLKGGVLINRTEPMSSPGLNKMLRRMSKKAGINKDFWSYLFRHTRATRLYEELPTPIVEKLMGHHQMYNVYAHISDKKAREELINKVYKSQQLSPESKAELEDIKKELEVLKLRDKEREKEMAEISILAKTLKNFAEGKGNSTEIINLLEKR